MYKGYKADLYFMHFCYYNNNYYCFYAMQIHYTEVSK